MKRGFLIALVLCVQTRVIAQEAKTPTQEIKTKNQVDPALINRLVDQRVQEIFYSSRLEREKKKYQVNLGLSALDFNLPTYTLEGGHFLDRDNVLILRYSKTLITEELGSGYSSSGRTEISPFSFTAGLKMFSGNSFYALGGLSYYHSTGTTFQNGSKTKERYRDLSFKASLGNEWQWRRMTIGTEWIGFNTRLAKLETPESRSFTVGDTDEDIAISMSYLRFYMGVSF